MYNLAIKYNWTHTHTPFLLTFTIEFCAYRSFSLCSFLFARSFIEFTIFHINPLYELENAATAARQSTVASLLNLTQNTHIHYTYNI